MELVDLTVTMEDFIEKWLPKTHFTLGDIERQARRQIESVPQQELRVVIGDTCLHIPCWSLAIYLGLASPCRTEHEEDAPESEPPTEAEVEAMMEDEGHVSTDPIGIDDTPPEEVVEKRKPGRPKKA
jgi:hypothetical protein